MGLKSFGARRNGSELENLRHLETVPGDAKEVVPHGDHYGEVLPTYLERKGRLIHSLSADPTGTRAKRDEL